MVFSNVINMFVATFSVLEQRELAEKLTWLLSTYRRISDSYIIVMNQQFIAFLFMLYALLCLAFVQVPIVSE